MDHQTFEPHERLVSECSACKKAPCECGPCSIDFRFEQARAYNAWSYYGLKPQPDDTIEKKPKK